MAYRPLSPTRLSCVLERCVAAQSAPATAQRACCRHGPGARSAAARSPRWCPSSSRPRYLWSARRSSRTSSSVSAEPTPSSRSMPSCSIRRPCGSTSIRRLVPSTRTSSRAAATSSSVNCSLWPLRHSLAAYLGTTSCHRSKTRSISTGSTRPSKDRLARSRLTGSAMTARAHSAL